MGLYSDILEDKGDKEPKLADLPEDYGVKLTQEIKAKYRYACPLCGEYAKDEDALQNHFRTQHGGEDAYIRADKMIIREEPHYFKTMPKELTLVLMGKKRQALCTIYDGGNHCIEKIELSQPETSLMPYTDACEDKQMHVVLSGKGIKQQSFSLVFGVLPRFVHKEVDFLAYEALFLKLNRGKRPDFSKFRKKYIERNENFLEYRYAVGLHEYAMGCHLEQSGEVAKSNLECAYSSLHPFITPFALTAKKALGFGMNDFAVFADSSIRSKFCLVDWFFNLPDGRIEDRVVQDFQIIEEPAVYVDDFTLGFMNALESYYRGKKGELADCIRTLMECKNALRNKNHKDKMYLLKARTAIQNNDRETALFNYEKIKNTRLFGPEAKEKIEWLKK